MMKNLFTSSSGSDSISCGIPRCIAGEERRDDTMDSRGVIVSGEGGVWKTKVRGWKWSSKNNKVLQKKSMGLIQKTNSKITKAKAKQLQVFVINQRHNKQTDFFFLPYSCVPTVSQATNQSMICTCGSMCTLWGLMTGTGFTIIKRHKQQAVVSKPKVPQWLLFMSGQHHYLSGNFISMWMTWYGLTRWEVQIWWSYLLVGWQCDI